MRESPNKCLQADLRRLRQALNGSALFVPEQDFKLVPPSRLWVPLEELEVVASRPRSLWVATFQVWGCPQGLSPCRCHKCSLVRWRSHRALSWVGVSPLNQARQGARAAPLLAALCEVELRAARLELEFRYNV